LGGARSRLCCSLAVGDREPALSDAATYFGGHDANKAPAHNAVWIAREHRRRVRHPAHWNKPVNAERQAMVAAAMGHPGEDAGDVLGAFIAGLGNATQPRRGQYRGGELRPHGRRRDGHAVGAAQPAADRRPGAGPRNPRTSGVRPAAVSPAFVK